jgi:hypothetical protein
MELEKFKTAQTHGLPRFRHLSQIRMSQVMAFNFQSLENNDFDNFCQCSHGI